MKSDVKGGGDIRFNLLKKGGGGPVRLKNELLKKKKKKKRAQSAPSVSLVHLKSFLHCGIGQAFLCCATSTAVKSPPPLSGNGFLASLANNICALLNYKAYRPIIFVLYISTKPLYSIYKIPMLQQFIS